MESLKEIYRIGKGPSSSHTMGPEHASKLFLEKNQKAAKYLVTLYGSLSKTGKGHMTDQIIIDTFKNKNIEVVFGDGDESKLYHPNTMTLEAFDESGKSLDFWRVYSVGGGKIEIEGQPSIAVQDVYPLNTFSEIKAYCDKTNMRLHEYVREVEGDEIFLYLSVDRRV